jgi:hypothetical protein
MKQIRSMSVVISGSDATARRLAGRTATSARVGCKKSFEIAVGSTHH